MGLDSGSDLGVRRLKPYCWQPGVLFFLFLGSLFLYFWDARYHKFWASFLQMLWNDFQPNAQAGSQAQDESMPFRVTHVT